MQTSPETSPAKSYYAEESPAKIRFESRFENWNSILLQKSGEEKLVLNPDKIENRRS